MAPLSSGDAQKALVSLAIEKALLEIGNAALEEVGNRLYAKYKCYFIDCLEHPDYLKDTLDEMFGLCHDSIIQSIERYLAEFVHEKPITKFLAVIR